MISERPELINSQKNGDLINSRRMYAAIAPYIIGKTVFEFGCGYGHGSNLLSSWSLKYLGFDPDKNTVAKANSLFESNKLSFTHDLEEVKGPFDMIISVEVIEHLEKEDLFEKLKWFSQLSKSIFITTPNGNMIPYHPKTLAERRGFHTWHYTYEELSELFGNFYSYVDIRGIIRDPNLDKGTGKWIGYGIYASNNISLPNDYHTSYMSQGSF